MDEFQVVVGNIGTVYCGNSTVDAIITYDGYVKQSKLGNGRAAWEEVTLFMNDEIVREHHPRTSLGMQILLQDLGNLLGE